MTDANPALDAIVRAANDLVPQLTERLVRHGLGEIEVSSGDLRLRVARSTSIAPTAPATQAATKPASPPSAPARADGPVAVASPAVGFFVYAEGLGPGQPVEKGDALGQVEMLGIRHDVRAPRRGKVGHLVAESGEAVEYGQVVVELDVAEAAR